MKTRKNAKVQIVYNPVEFKEKGFDGEISKYMYENRNTAIVGDIFGVDRHIIKFEKHSGWFNYENPY